MSQHNVEVNVTANTQQAQRSLGYLQSLMGEFGKQATNRFAAMFGAAAVAKMAFDKVTQAISANIATAKQVSQMAIKFNIDPVAMHSITMAAKDAGVNVRALTMAMKQLGQYAGKAMTNKDMQANFKQLGIEADKLNEIQAAPSKFLPEIAKALMQIGDENQRASAGATLLGRQYTALMPLVEELGSSEEARAKFLENDNAMTEEQIAQNKEIAKLQNDLSDGFDKMVASVTPLLAWAMDFIGLLARGAGYIKDMIIESDKARAERETKEALTVTTKVEAYRDSLKKRQEEGTLSEREKGFIEEAGGIDAFIGQQAKAIEDMELSRQKANDLGKKRLTDVVFARGLDFRYHTMLRDEEQVRTRELAGKVKKEFASALGIDDDASSVDRFQSESELTTAAQKGVLRSIHEKGVEEVKRIQTKNASEAALKAEKERKGKYIALRQSQASVTGLIYDPITDDNYTKAEYEQLMVSRGDTKDEAKEKVKAFEKEEDRKKREKQMEASGRKLATSERKLYVGDPSQGRYKEGLDEAEKAAEALQDAIDAQVDPLKDLNEQLDTFNDLATDLSNAQGANFYLGVENDEEILRLTSQLEVEEIKLNDLQAKQNDLKGQEVAAEEALKRAKENVYREEVKRKDEVFARMKAEQDHEKQLKYKVMKAEGKTQREIAEERITDESKEYEMMIRRYTDKMNEYSQNEAKGLKGEALSEKETAELESLTKELEGKKRGILDLAFDFGNQGDKGQVTSMRRIGGGGLEYGGLANTAKEQLEVQKKMLAALEGRYGFSLNPQASYGGKQGTTFALLDSYTGADGSPR